LSDVRRALSSKTKAFILAFVYGCAYDTSYIAEELAGLDVDIIEDCAQSWQSLELFRGSPHAVMTMFSFGTIKHNAAGAGAVTIFRQKADHHTTRDQLPLYL